MNSLRPLFPRLPRILGSYKGLTVFLSTHLGALGENENVESNFVNRNPRNMEMLRLAHKPQGWELEASSPKYWYKLNLEQSNRHTTGQVVHYTGTIVVSASTREWSIKQQLYSTADVNAAENIGRILAQRCLESGITEVYTELEQFKDSSEKIRAFLSAVTEGGVCPKESSTINEVDVQRWAWTSPVLPWHMPEEKALDKELETNVE
ncbi:large ribosomal subunit protein uL18m [Procambarus clarkii]|uniref:large ribosomal subunit protein uL18m n=1 Tax=Procambarus clarkii TaxID=6728 RepID=UPI001E673813|nr:39S ribosomal protein L18, mitochondrial-like [Procambarus clarkii]